MIEIILCVVLLACSILFFIYNRVSKRYIKVDTILQNAILEAYIQALENDNNFEIKTYKKLLAKIK